MQIASLLSLVSGALLFGVITRYPMAPLSWAAIALLVHASRSTPLVTGMAWLWVALYAALAIGERGVLPIAGPAYFVIVAAVTTSVTFPFAVDRLAGVSVATPLTRVWCAVLWCLPYCIRGQLPWYKR